MTHWARVLQEWQAKMKRYGLRQSDTSKLYEDVIMADVKKQIFDFRDFMTIG